MKTYWLNLSYLLSFPLLLLVSVTLTVTNPFSACFIDLSGGWINPESFPVAFTMRFSGLSEPLMPLPGFMSDSFSASQCSSLSFGLSKSQFQLSQLSVSESLSGALSTSLQHGWRSILLILQTFNTWICPPKRFFADNAAGKGDLSDNWNAAVPLCSKFNPDALIISLVSEMYATVAVCLFWEHNSFCVAHRFWLPCHISKKS